MYRTGVLHPKNPTDLTEHLPQGQVEKEDTHITTGVKQREEKEMGDSPTETRKPMKKTPHTVPEEDTRETRQGAQVRDPRDTTVVKGTSIPQGSKEQEMLEMKNDGIHSMAPNKRRRGTNGNMRVIKMQKTARRRDKLEVEGEITALTPMTLGKGTVIPETTVNNIPKTLRTNQYQLRRK
jgi:hypothetical protein